jgi:alkylation response protein AidB-like acyl-CoA dehydrogenase
MDLGDSPAESAFRTELRAWIEAHHPGPEPLQEDENFAFRLAWQKQLHAAGYVGLSWPIRYGGAGAPPVHRAIFAQEIAWAEAPEMPNFVGLEMTGPVLMARGTEAQRDRYLAPILAGDEIWCQGFSEPEAGSDLASLRTRATKVDGGWSITGQKIWTSGAQRSDRCLLLARTGEQAKRHRAITFFLLSLDQPGIEIRPMKQIDGGSDFNEVFFEGAFVADEDVVGDVDGGWSVAMITLTHERANTGFQYAITIRRQLNELVRLARDQELLADPAVRRRLARIHIAVENVRLNALRGLSSEMRDGSPGPEGSLPKWQFSEVDQEMTAFALELVPAESGARAPWEQRFLRARSDSIMGGTTEVQKNIIAERVLGLPRAPRPV